MSVSDQQVRKLMDEYRKHEKVGLAAARAGMDRKTARKYLASGKLPSECREVRQWRTREDPFEEHWPYLESILREIPEIEAVALFDHLIELHPGRYEDGQLRTLQRRLKQWRAAEGPPKDLFFPQRHRPGEAMQTDFTRAKSLEITIQGEPFDHLLCHPVLPFSNWEWVTVCQSESMAALKRGVQAALFELSHVPAWHQTDNSTAATHDLRTGKRGFNAEYLDFVEHFGMKPRTTGIGEKEQNGDVESLNGALKRRLIQLLLLRGNRDFASVGEYETWVQACLRKLNRTRQRRLSEELDAMTPLVVRRLPEYRDDRVRVTSGSMIKVRGNSYSVPSQLRGEWVRARVFDQCIEVYYGEKLRLTVERLRGKGGHHVNYRHVIDSLVRKPGAFERYRYREDFFPSAIFRKTYDVLCGKLPLRKAEIEYLRCLQLAAKGLETEVEATLGRLLDAAEVPTAAMVKSSVRPEQLTIPVIQRDDVDLSSYDALIECAKEAS